MTALVALSACGSSENTGTSPAHDKLATLCQQSTGRDSAYCGCVADESIKRGYDTDAEIAQLNSLVITVNQTGNTALLPAAVNEALNACASTG